jgi:hypothetical protein
VISWQFPVRPFVVIVSTTHCEIIAAARLAFNAAQGHPELVET